MDDRRRRLLVLAAGQLAIIVGMIHVGVGLRYWGIYALAGSIIPPDIRIPLWTISGIGLLIGVVLTVRREPGRRRVAYGLGAALMVIYILGYYAWHLGGHRTFFIAGNGRFHDTDLLTFLLDHTVSAGPIEMVALLTETLLLGLLAVLLYGDRSDQC